MKKHKHLALILVCLIFLTSCSSAPIEFKGDYGIITSNAMSRAGMIFDIDSEGAVLQEKKIKFMDGSFYNISDKHFIVSGARANNSIVVDKAGNMQELFLLNDKNYSGVTDINIYGDIVAGLMNMGGDEIGYKALLVLQNLNGDIIHEENLYIYAFASVIINDKLIINGTNHYAGGNDVSTVIEFDLQTLKITKKIEHPNYTAFAEMIHLDNKFYAITGDKNYDDNLITTLDADYNIIDEFDFKEEIRDIKEYKGEIYVTFYDRVVIYDKNMQALETLELNLEKDGFPDVFIIDDNYLYIHTRLLDRVRDKEKGTSFGYIYKINLDNFKIEKKTKLQFKNDNYVENILFFPTAFLDK